MSAAKKCDYCGVYADIGVANPSTLPPGWWELTRGRDADRAFHWCGKCDPRTKSLATSQKQ